MVLRDNELLTKVPGYRYLKNARRKYPDRLADSCKRSSVNRMAAGSRLHVQVMDFFFFRVLFKHALCSKVKGFRPHGLLVYRLCLPPDTPIIIIIIEIGDMVASTRYKLYEVTVLCFAVVCV